ncbi:MAG TPA: hypothetical protein VMK12_29960 [Anaeromyxobacteraceae bacterium]|nr:hypothetical protein [Anaeromyxobacteraceae bacterium]
MPEARCRRLFNRSYRVLGLRYSHGSTRTGFLPEHSTQPVLDPGHRQALKAYYSTERIEIELFPLSYVRRRILESSRYELTVEFTDL